MSQGIVMTVVIPEELLERCKAEVGLVVRPITQGLEGFDEFVAKAIKEKLDHRIRSKRASCFLSSRHIGEPCEQRAS